MHKGVAHGSCNWCIHGAVAAAALLLLHPPWGDAVATTKEASKKGCRMALALAAYMYCSGNGSCWIPWGLHYFVVAKDACRKREGVEVATVSYIDAVAIAVASTKGVQGGRGSMDKAKRRCRVCGGAEPSKSRLIFTQVTSKSPLAT